MKKQVSYLKQTFLKRVFKKAFKEWLRWKSNVSYKCTHLLEDVVLGQENDWILSILYLT